MNAAAHKQTIAKILPIVVALLVVAGLGYMVFAKGAELRDLLSAFTGSEPDKEEEDSDHPPHDQNVLTLSPEACSTWDVDTRPLQLTDYGRMLRVPAQVAEISGKTHREVTSSTSGKVGDIFVREGESISPGTPLFRIEVVHDEAVTTQLELIDALSELESISAEIARLQTLPVAGRDILQLQYRQNRLRHTVNSRRDTLLLLGFSHEAVGRVIAEHQHQHEHAVEGTEVTNGHSMLLTEVTITAPSGDEGMHYLVENLGVHLGEHVEVGSTLCRLGDYRHLTIEGYAFERDLDAIRHATVHQWEVSATWQSSLGTPSFLDELSIRSIHPTIDSATGLARFLVNLTNPIENERRDDGRLYVDWAFHPGQRMRLQVPIEQHKEVFVVPLTAIAQHGLKNYMFEADLTSDGGYRFTRREVAVVLQDEDRAVLAETPTISEGLYYEMKNAYQLQLAIESQNQGPQTGGAHAGHSH